jgi:membrane protease YdiL (CAAX protease family)
MSLPLLPPTSRWHIFWVLFKAAKRRAAGRRKHHNQLWRKKTGDSDHSMAVLGLVMMALLTSLVHLFIGWMLTGNLELMQIEHLEQEQNILVVNRWNYDDLKEIEQRRLALQHAEKRPQELAVDQKQYAEEVDDFVQRVAQDWEDVRGRGRAESSRFIRTHFEKHGLAGFQNEAKLHMGKWASPNAVPLTYWPFVVFMLVWWLVMMVFQGEGLNLDTQRRRHPMWEWLQSHPVSPVAVFIAEILTPLGTNPIYWSAPLFWWVILAEIFDPWWSLGAALVIGLMLAVAASCLYKALEIAAMLRLSVRVRGVVLGLMSWVGYVALVLPMFVWRETGMKSWLARSVAELESWLPTLQVRWLIMGWSIEPSLWQVLLCQTLFAIALILSAVMLAWWGMQCGLQSSGQGKPNQPRLLQVGSGRAQLAGNALYRKELLWFWRDKSAIVQVLLIPLTIAVFQAFQFRQLAVLASEHWNSLCGLGIICGTYFLLVLGPRSLASEGSALWIVLTWPRGLEDLLKAKARLWWLIVNGIVLIFFSVAVWMFPGDWWRILLVSVAWVFFSRSLAEKSVTLVTVPSSSGEMERPSAGRRWAAMLGTFAFGSGVAMQVWHSAIIGLVFSALTAAAMWQNLRARLPFLYDRWSEKLPQPPTLMHAMIGIIVMVDLIGIVTAFTSAAGAGGLYLARAISYGAVGFVVFFFMNSFLQKRGVKAADIWLWQGDGKRFSAFLAFGGSVLLGLLLGGVGLLYTQLLELLPVMQETLQAMAKVSAAHSEQRVWLYILGIVLAPFAEEYFFRGLLYRALDREWGGWQAWVGSAAFFTIYHPPISWLPVFAVGLVNAWLFKANGRLLPCVLLHMVYNAVVLLTQ